jgi:GTP cyclohydrolase II
MCKMSSVPFDEVSAERVAPSHLPHVGTRLSNGAAWVEVYARANLPTRFGVFESVVFRASDGKEHVALVRGDVRDAHDLPTRLHSECLTGDALGSLRCDCRDQLEQSLTTVGGLARGLVLYLRQEGRGIGLGNKIRAYALQEAGLDTFEANRHLGFDDDLRTYDVAALMLRALGVRSLLLATNNPRKIFGLRHAGIEVTGRTPVIGPENPHNVRYLRTKARKDGHLLPV